MIQGLNSIEYKKSVMERIRKNFFRVLLFAYTLLSDGKIIAMGCYDVRGLGSN